MGANATTSVPSYVAGEVLTAADLNVTNSGIPVFADSTARTNGFGGSGEKVLAEGQFAYLESDDKTYYYDGTSWKQLGLSAALQVVSTVKTDTFSASTAVGAFSAVTGLTVTITPSSASNKVLLIASVVCAAATAPAVGAKFSGGNTATYRGDTASNRLRLAASGYHAGRSALTLSLVYLDSPATTSATTYGIDLGYLDNGSATDTIYCNRSASDSDHNYTPRNASTITAIEVLP
jgi:hypothetical protein